MNNAIKRRVSALETARPCDALSLSGGKWLGEKLTPSEQAQEEREWAEWLSQPHDLSGLTPELRAWMGEPA